MDQAISLIKKELKHLDLGDSQLQQIKRKGNSLYFNGQVMLLSTAKSRFEFAVDDEFEDYQLTVITDETLGWNCSCKSKDLCAHVVAGFYRLMEELVRDEVAKPESGKAYSREGMIRRVIQERRQKAIEANYRLESGTSLFGEYILTNEQAVKYRITLHDLEKETGYCTCSDYATNKLGTCKHLMFIFHQYHEKNSLKKLTSEFPFVDVYADPLNAYKPAWFFAGTPPLAAKSVLEKHFTQSGTIQTDSPEFFLDFVRESENIKQIRIRPEIILRYEKLFNRQKLKELKDNTSLDYTLLKADLFSYQKEGIEFAVFREGAIIADEMGLGKTLQAIGTAVFKKQLFGFKRCLVICPASLKDQWKREIEKFSSEKALIAEGFPEERERMYQPSDAYFVIVNYETILRDYPAINKNAPDFIILDEAQRIKNFDTLTSNCIKSLKKRHSLVITGTPIENRLIDLYSITAFIDPFLLAPLWEFSQEHCYFDHRQKDKITGYYNLAGLNTRMSDVIIRREKRQVISQLPNITVLDIPVKMHPDQEYFHAGYARGIAQILAKLFKTPFDMQKLMLLLSKMRMVCDSTYLVDLETNTSPKLEELKYILTEKLDLQNNDRKVIIFSEWKRMNHIIGKMLRDVNIGFAELNGSVPVNKRGLLIREFEDNPLCKVFISTEAGGSGLNLQVADTVINFELPWNPAKKNQRFGRIDRIGQRSKNLTVISFITRNSIEEKIAAGMVLKQSLFDGVLNKDSGIDEVDFSEKGKSQFLVQLQETISQFTTGEDVTDVAEVKDVKEVKGGEDVEKGEEVVKIGEEGLGEVMDIDGVTREESEPGVAVAAETEVQPVEQFEQVMNQGMGFLAGLFKMATGKDLIGGNQMITIDKETGEVTMKFKMPRMGRT